MHKYRVKCKFKGNVMELGTDGLNYALTTAKSFADTWTEQDSQSGSLRGDGEITLWLEGEKEGFARVEQYIDGQYERIGG